MNSAPASLHRVEIRTLRAHFVHKRRAMERLRRRIKIRNWLPLVDALRTLLLVPSPDLREMLEHRWAHRRLGAQPGI
jgi:hypothetical protein